jgi:hypothetical protein
VFDEEAVAMDRFEYTAGAVPRFEYDDFHRRVEFRHAVCGRQPGDPATHHDHRFSSVGSVHRSGVRVD